MTTAKRPAAAREPPIQAATPMTAIAHALLAISAADDGDRAEALAHIATAQRHSRTTARRHRQVVEIAALVVAEQRERAGGLALIHTAEFPDDTKLLARVTTNAPAKGLTPDANTTTAGSPDARPSMSPTSLRRRVADE